MTDKHEPGYHFGKREAAIAATGGIVSLASILWIHNHKAHETVVKESDPYEKFRDRAAILIEPRLRDKRPRLNRLAAHILHLEMPNRTKLIEAMDTTRHKLGHLTGYLVTNQLVEHVHHNPRQQIQSHYQPTEALTWAATQPAEFPDLAEAIAELKAGRQSTDNS